VHVADRGVVGDRVVNVVEHPFDTIYPEAQTVEPLKAFGVLRRVGYHVFVLHAAGQKFLGGKQDRAAYTMRTASHPPELRSAEHTGISMLTQQRRPVFTRMDAGKAPVI